MNKCAAAAAVNERHPIKNDSRHGNIGYNFNEFLRTRQKKLLRFGRSDGFFGVCLDRKLFEEFLDMGMDSSDSHLSTSESMISISLKKT